MDINFMNLPAHEAERICYIEGFENAAKLFERIDALQYALGQATAALVAIQDGPMNSKQAAGAARETLGIISRVTP
jgi:hypothetical protein